MDDLFPTLKKILVSPKTAAHYEKQLHKLNDAHDERGRFGSGGGTSGGAAGPKVSQAAADAQNISAKSNELNQQATEIRRGGDAPFFSNTVHSVVNGKSVDFHYEGVFRGAEPSNNGSLLKVSYNQHDNNPTYTKFRADQLGNIELSS